MPTPYVPRPSPICIARGSVFFLRLRHVRTRYAEDRPLNKQPRAATPDPHPSHPPGPSDSVPTPPPNPPVPPISSVTTGSHSAETTVKMLWFAAPSTTIRVCYDAGVYVDVELLQNYGKA